MRGKGPKSRGSGRRAENNNNGTRIRMTKSRPKLSKDEEETQAMALFDDSIPTALRSKKVQKVIDSGEKSSTEEDDSSGSESDVRSNPMNQLLSVLGVNTTQPSSSSEEAEDDSGNDEDDSDEEVEDALSEEGSDSEEEGGDFSSDDPDDLHPADDHKRPHESSTEEEGEEETASGSEDMLSLADSSSEGDLLESAQDASQVHKGAQKPKRLKALDYSVDPVEEEEETRSKTVTAVTESIKSDDPFSTHFEQDIEDDLVLSLSDRKQWQTEKLELANLGKASFSHLATSESLKIPAETISLPSLGLRSRLFNLIGKTLKQNCKIAQAGDREPSLTPAQRDMFAILNQYKDVYNPTQTFATLEEQRMVYCLHSLNHILKTRLRVTLNSEEKRESESKKQKQSAEKEYRDQGLTRPKVLILVPFKESARRVVNMFESLLMIKKKSFVTNKKRFTEEFTLEDEADIDPKKPDDYVKMFEGNTDDCFRLGIQLGKSGMKLYADFYKADILVCSPLGLRLILGAEGDLKRDYDFMSSIEVLIVDQADVFLMQNWDHVLHTMSLLHVQPKQSHDTDFSRIRMWTLNGHSKHYRQTIVQSSVHSPQLSALFTKHCSNFAGELRIQPPDSNGSICHIVSQMPQIFQRFDSKSPATLADDRFNYFVKEVLPQYTGKERMGTLIYVPSYHDYVRLRNHLHKEKHDTSLVCEYTSDKSVRRAKKKFFTKETHFMLYTERVHFFRRMHLRKIRQLIFYSLPTYPQFFSEICNMYRTVQQADASCLVLFSNFEAYKLAMCVGTERTQHIINTKKNIFMFVTGDE